MSFGNYKLCKQRTCVEFHDAPFLGLLLLNIYAQSLSLNVSIVREKNCKGRDQHLADLIILKIAQHARNIAAVTEPDLNFNIHVINRHETFLKNTSCQTSERAHITPTSKFVLTYSLK